MPRLRQFLAHPVREFRRRAVLDRLARAGGTAAHVGAALRLVLEGGFTGEERGWIRRIEAVRTAMHGSGRSFVRTDFGAGAAADSRSDQAMRAGIEVPERLADFSRKVSKPPFWCEVLFALVRRLQPRRCVEMGTAVGVSGAYQAAALKLNGAGTLVTLEGSAAVAQIAGENFAGLGLEPRIVVGRFEDTLPGVLRELGTADYVFVDGHHDEHATLRYFEQLKPHLVPGALVAFDDIAWSDGMRRAWQALAAAPGVSLAVDLGAIGLCVVAAGPPQHLRLPLD